MEMAGISHSRCLCAEFPDDKPEAGHKLGSGSLLESAKYRSCIAVADYMADANHSIVLDLSPFFEKYSPIKDGKNI
jgi:hypothetical protein